MMLKPLLIFVSLVLMTSCGLSARIEPYMDAQSTLGQNDSVVILGRKHQANYQTESALISCVASNLSSGSNAIPIYPTRSFEDLLFPWFEPSLAPLTIDDFAVLLENDLVFNSIENSGVKYIVWLDGSTDRNDSGGTISCSAGPGGAGCIGLAWWEDGSRYDATVWDIDTMDSAGTIYVDYTGRSMIPALIIPIPLIIRTQNEACTGISDQLGSFFSQNY